MAEVRRDQIGELYEVLEVSPRASHEVIQAAYRVLARNSHPDRNATESAEQRIRQINAAYEVLGDPSSRARYDLECARARRHERLVSGERAATGTVTASVTAGPRASSANGRVRVLPVAARKVERRADERLPLINLQAVLLLFVVAAFGAVMLALVWMSLDAIPNDDQMSTDSPALYTRPIIDVPRR